MMKSHFSRILHYPLSYSGLTRISRSNKVANLSNLDYRVKFENDSICAGRSMVEMLGVLAIIGVLSVGAIAGYSKAMMKYKLNQHAQAVNMLINNTLTMKDSLPRDGSDAIGYNYYGTILLKTNSLPDGIKYLNNFRLQDMWFKNLIWIFTTILITPEVLDLK